MGEGSYLAPPVDAWSSGVTLFTLLSGFFPFGRADARADERYKLFLRDTAPVVPPPRKHGAFGRLGRSGGSMVPAMGACEAIIGLPFNVTKWSAPI